MGKRQFDPFLKVVVQCVSKPTFCCENQNDLIFPYDVLCTCAVLWKIEQFISQEHANKSLVLDTWKIVIMHCKKLVDFTVKYLASGCQFFYRYWAFTCRTFLEIKIW